MLGKRKVLGRLIAALVLAISNSFHCFFKVIDLQSTPDPVAESDFGRRYGWFIERDGATIGELEYIRWDSHSQFWHEYRLNWRSPSDAVIGPDEWISSKLVLRNRHYTDVLIDSFLTSPEREEGVIAVRFAYVTKERIRQGRAV